jgi:hypothetical protein
LYEVHNRFGNQDSPVSIMTSLHAEWQGNCCQLLTGAKNFAFSAASGPAVGPIQPSVQGILGSLLLVEVKWSESEVDSHISM